MTISNQLDRLELLDLVEVFGQARRKGRKRVRVRIKFVGRLGRVDHGADAGIGQQLQEQRMRRGTVNDVSAKYAADKRIDGRAQFGNHALIDLATVEHLINLVER